jgi:uncharacterized SAM-binding protein YcdF (DUF218 family)
MNIYALLVYFSQPTVLIYSALGFAIFRAWWIRPDLRRGLRGIAFFYVLFPLLALPATEHYVLGGLERQNPPSSESSTIDADAIVVLSGDVFQPDVMRPEPEPGPSTLYRCLHAADLYRKKACPVIVSGATSDPDSVEVGCAPVMRDLLIKFGVNSSDLIVENNSFSTYENAVACRKIIEEKNFRRVILVTDASHLPRAVRCFRSQGIDVVPSGCQYRSSHLGIQLPGALPSIGAARMVQRACHEWEGIFWYWLRGRI